MLLILILEPITSPLLFTSTLALLGVFVGVDGVDSVTVDGVDGVDDVGSV